VTATRNDQIEGMARVLRWLWIAFLAATGVYLVIAIVIVRSRAGAGGLSGAIRSAQPAFWAAGAAALLMAIFLRRRLLARTYRERDAALIGVQTALLVGWTATEAVALIGLVLVLLGGGLLDGAPFFLAAFLLIARQRPSADWLREEVQSAFGRGGNPASP
jgi:FtsH-binding integral membrane protein